MIRNVDVKDAGQICEIYNHYVDKTTITFETESVDITEMSNRIETTTDSLLWFVYEVDNKIIGYAYASRWKGCWFTPI